MRGSIEIVYYLFVVIYVIDVRDRDARAVRHVPGVVFLVLILALTIPARHNPHLILPTDNLQPA